MWYEGRRAAAGCGGRERALSGYERSASRQSRAGQKAVELPPACRQAAQGTRKLETQPVSDLARHPYMLMNLGQRDEPPLQVRPMFNVGATAYEHRDITAYDQEYNQIIDFLISECRRKGILLLANKRDPTYRYNNKFAVVYDKAVFRYIGPDVVWRDGFDF